MEERVNSGPKKHDWSYTEIRHGRDLRWPPRPEHPEMHELAVKMSAALTQGGAAAELVALMERVGICPIGNFENEER